MESHPAPAGARLTRCVARMGPCHAPAAPDPSGAADITASGLISRPAAASRFLSNLCAGGSSVLAAGQEERPAGLLCGAAAPACLALISPGEGPKIPARAPGELRAPLTVPRSEWLVPFLLVPQETQIVPKEITALALLALHGAPPVSPCLVLGARSSPTAQRWMQSSDRDAPCATTIPVILGHIPGSGVTQLSPGSPPGSRCSAPHSHSGLAENNPRQSCSLDPAGKHPGNAKG